MNENKMATTAVLKETSIYYKHNGDRIDNVIEYLKEYLYNHSHYDCEIWLGCDSQKQYHNSANYVIVICIYRKGKGAHIIHTKTKQKITSIYDKLWKETELSIIVADYFKNNDFLKLRPGEQYYSAYSMGKKVSFRIDLDYNTDADAVSSFLLQAGMGYCEQNGYYSVAKPWAWAAQYAADGYARNKFQSKRKTKAQLYRMNKKFNKKKKK